MSDPPPYKSPHRGDIVRGRMTGTWYLVVDVRGEGPSADLSLVVLQPEGPSVRARGEVIPLGRRDITPPGLIFQSSSPSLLAHWREYGRLPGGNVLDPDPTTEPISNPTTSKEDTPMNSNHIQQAINDLRAEEARAATKPVYKEISKLVRKTKVGQAIVVTKPNDQVFGTQFRVRTDEDQWQYGNGTTYKTTDQTIETLVLWKMDGAVIVRLVEEVSS